MSASDGTGVKKVLLVPSTSEPSGVATYVVNVANALGPARCAVIAESHSALADALPAGCRLVPAQAGRLGLARALARNRSRFGFFQAHGPRALLTARIAAIPPRHLGYVFHEIHGARHRPELLLARGIRVAANGPAAARWAGAQLGTQVGWLPPVVTVAEALPRDEARALLGVPTDGLLVGVVGRLSDVKCPLLAVEAVAHSRMPATLVFVGDGPERPAILAAAHSRRVRVHLTGSVPEASKVVTAFDALLSCSPYETFGLAAAEAIVARVPVVAVDSPGLRELTGHGRWLRLVPPDAISVAAELETTLDIGAPSRELREYVLLEFGPETQGMRLHRYYESVVEGTSR